VLDFVEEMATCPRCLGPLSDGHRCRPIWIKRALRQTIAVLAGGLLGGLIQFLLDPKYLPAMGFVIGGLFAFALSEGMKD
jgi:hypothetical protein